MTVTLGLSLTAPTCWGGGTTTWTKGTVVQMSIPSRRSIFIKPK